MSEKSNIEWTDSTHNFWRGCSKVSPGCTHCYAEALVTTRLGGKWGNGAPRVLSKDFDAPLRWNKKPLVCDHCGTPRGLECHDQCVNLKCPSATRPNIARFHQRRVFSLSLGDWLDKEVSAEARARMLDIVRRCGSLVWQLVTKRPQNFDTLIGDTIEFHSRHPSKDDAENVYWLFNWLDGYAPRNIWVIASTENQEAYDARREHLLKIPAQVHGLSCEPLLGPIDFKHHLGPVDIVAFNGITGKGETSGGIEWVIVGGESGPSARPCHVGWVRNIVEQCKAARTACFVKQLGRDSRRDISNFYPAANINDPESDPASIAAQEAFRHSAPLHLADKKGGDWSQWPGELADLKLREFPKL